MYHDQKDDDLLQEGDHSTLFVNDVGKVDCALFDPSQGAIGQSWYVDVELSGPLDQNGFVMDFSLLKSLIKQVLSQAIDHTLIIPVGSQAVQVSAGEGTECWRLKTKPRSVPTEYHWKYTCPQGAVFPIRTIALKAAVIEQELARILKHRLPPSIAQLKVKLREEAIAPTEAFYRYTHGIQGHNGLCQRLLHGHRSRIEIYIGDERRADLEHFIAREVFGSYIHIATLNQIKSGDGKVGCRGSGDQPVVLSYQGSLGSYELSIPAHRVFFVEKETSVECIAREIARFIRKEEKPQERVLVRCFEGIDKGASASD